MAVVVLLAGLLCLDGAVLAARVEHFPVHLHPGPGTTWVVLGLDSRADLPAGSARGNFGTADEVPGSRADVVLVVHESAAGTTVLSVPRDVVTEGGRLALSWLDGPQATVDALCGLGIPTDHLVTVDLAGFVGVADAVGGIDVDVPEPVRDRAAGLLLTRSGRQRVAGATALAMVRSRHPEHRVDGRWTPAAVDPDGRASAAGAVLGGLSAGLRRALGAPWRLQRIGWAASGALATDASTSMTDLASLAGTDIGPVSVLPVGDPVGGTLARFPDSATRKALTAAGMSCSG